MIVNVVNNKHFVKRKSHYFFKKENVSGGSLGSVVPSYLLGSKIYFRGHFFGPKCFLVGISWVQNIFLGSKIFLSGICQSKVFFTWEFLLVRIFFSCAVLWVQNFFSCIFYGFINFCRGYFMGVSYHRAFLGLKFLFVGISLVQNVFLRSKIFLTVICQSKVFSRGYFYQSEFFFRVLYCESKTFSHAYFIGSKTFLVGISWVKTFFTLVFCGFEILWFLLRGRWGRRGIGRRHQ